MNNQLYKNITDVLNNKNESEVKEYILKHFSEFPEDIQGNIIMGFFEEGLSKVTERNQIIDNLQERGLKMIDVLIKEKKQ